MQNAQSPECRNVAVVLFPDFSNHCLANTIEPMRAANKLSGKHLYQWHYLSVDGADVTSSSGLPVRPEMKLSEHPGGAFLKIMPSYGYKSFCTPATLRGLRAAAGRFETLVGLDSGAWLMAAAGLLDGYRATIHWDERTEFSETFPEIEVVEERFVLDRNRITCGGASTSFELVLDLIQRHHGSMLRLEVASLFMLGSQARQNCVDGWRTGEQKIDDVIATMRQNIEAPLQMSAIAGSIGLGQRRFEALFQSQLGRPPRAVYKSIRLAEARRLLSQSKYSITEISGRCGYQDASAMSRAFRAEFGVSPTQARQRG